MISWFTFQQNAFGKSSQNPLAASTSKSCFTSSYTYTMYSLMGQECDHCGVFIQRLIETNSSYTCSLIDSMTVTAL